MELLIFYVLVALIFSFLCSIAEAVLLSVTTAYIALLEKSKKRSGVILRELKSDINKPLAAILTLNTIAHTIGAAGAGAQAAVVFGSAYVGIASAVLTLLILFLSEIIPKTLGASYWRDLAPAVAVGTKGITWLLAPFVWMSEKITRGMIQDHTLTGFSREEFSAIAELTAKEGKLGKNEYSILRNLLLLRQTPIERAMTPSTVIFSLPEKLLVEEFFHKYDQTPFSRILTYGDDKEDINGFVLRRDILLAHGRENSKNALSRYRRNIDAILHSVMMSHALKEMLSNRAQIMLVVDEYGSVKGMVTLEDIFETLLGLEIVDECDQIDDMQILAKRQWVKKRAKKGYKHDSN